MKLTVISAWIGLISVLSAAPKFATVRVTDIYRDLPSTAAMQDSMQAQRAEIIKNTRAERLRTVLAEMEATQGQLRDNKDNLETEAGKKLIQDYEIKRQEAETLRQEFERYRIEEEKRINKVFVTTTRESLNRIVAASQQIAKERNFDGVFDTSGNSNTGVPFVLYAANAEDITEHVVLLLGEKPAEAATKEPDTVPTDVDPKTEAKPETD